MSNEVLNNDALKAAAPSIFALQPHKSRSARYAHVPTIDVLEQLRKHGFVPTNASQSRVRSGHEDHFSYTRHMIRLRQRRDLDAPIKKVGDVVPEIVLLNAHDGSSSFRLDAGLFRMVCSNGLIIKSQDFGAIRVRHSGSQLITEVAEAADHLAIMLPKIVAVTKEWDKIKLTDAARTRFANKAIALRYNGNSPITAAQALTARRNDDEAPTLWRTYNVLEENLAKGGIEGKTASNRKSVTRSIKSVNNQLHFERGLWELAEKLAA